ncbi:unnamed protein product [Mucor hiemalis]
MSPKLTQQKSIKDHFAIIPKKKVELKVYPLFLKRKAPEKAIVEGLKVEAPPPPQPKTPSPKQQQQQQKQQLQQPRSPRRKKTCSRPHPLQEFINTNTSCYFQKQKTVREERCEQRKGKPFVARDLFDQDSIEEWMNKYYPKWKKEPCCEYLYNNIPRLRNNNNKIPWVTKYRPNEVEGLIGFLPDFQYVTEWLDKIKVTCHQDKKKQLTMSKDEDKLYNLISFIGDHGTGKTATAYTVAQEMGYSVFEINSSTRRAGKDILNQVGEMTESHLVRFNQRKRKNKGEIVIIRDTVVNKKPKTIDIATHFKRMLTVSNEKKEIVEENVIIEEVKTTRKIDSFFQNKTAESNAGVTTNEKVEEVDEEKDVLMEDVPKQSLVLLEEVDLLFEEDKGFWTAVIELCQKSKRPIIMTCNDESKIPFDYLDIQSKIYFDLPEKSSLLPYLQLLCFSEKYIVQPYDIECLCELYNYDTRRIISTLQLYLSPHSGDIYVECPTLFAQIMGFSDLIGIENSVTVLMDRLKGTSDIVKELCIKYYTESNTKEVEVEEEDIGIDTLCEMMETASFADAWIGLKDKQRHQLYDIDQYDDETDMITSTNEKYIYKSATDLDHWELGEIIENSISVMNLNRKSTIWSNPMSAWSSHWKHLYDTSLLVNCIEKSVCPLILSYPYYIGSLPVFMMEYMPHIRSICLNDDNTTTVRSTRKKRSRYIKLDDESRDIINWQQI